MKEIKVNDVYKDCEASCLFEKACACHTSAGYFRSSDGFTPEIFYDDETGKFYCKTASEEPTTFSCYEYPGEKHPISIWSLGYGFVKIEAPK